MSILKTLIAISALAFLATYFYQNSNYIVIGAVLLIWFIAQFAIKKIFKPEKYIDERGYVVMTKLKELEHRYLAKQIIKRELYQNEVVHHINGKRTDNSIENLCLMNNQKHEFFHAWLSWKFKKNRRYPSISEQKRVLEEEYGGKLLEKIRAQQSTTLDQENSDVVKNQNETKEEYSISKSRSGLTLPPTRQSRWEMMRINMKERAANAIAAKQKKDLAKKLFNELRKERKRLADERNVPVYMIFDNRTLDAMAEAMPETEESMMSIRGIGPTKFQMYGEPFMYVIRKFKADNIASESSSKDTA